MAQLAIIADDLTGAADSAALFAAEGFATAIPLRMESDFAADVVSVSTDSRDLPADDAALAVLKTISCLCSRAGGNPRLIYKKVDSALRGQIRAEIAATMDATGLCRAAFAPALPAEGRTTVGGRQLVFGVPLEQSSFGGDGTTSDLVANLTSPNEDVPVQLVDLSVLRADPVRLSKAFSRDGVVIVDAQTDADLDLIARMALDAGVALFAGSAGLARALARIGPFPPTRQAPDWAPANGRSILIVAGTRHPATARQIALLADHGIVIARPDGDTLDGGSTHIDTGIVEHELRAGRHVVLTTEGCPRSRLAPLAVANVLATVVDSEYVRTLAGGMILTGGDVAAAVCARLDANGIWLHGEVGPAIPWGSLSGGALPGVPIVTKAGSFGADDVLLAAINHLCRV